MSDPHPVQTGFRPGGDPLGCQRVVEPRGLLPQAASRLDASLPPYANEVWLAVDTLNIDAASFVQLAGSGIPIADEITRIISTCGKMHNPITGSGGMLMGHVVALGPDYDAAQRLEVGMRVATLVSLTLTPLHIAEILEIRAKNHQVVVRGHALLPPSAPIAVLPDDLAPTLALSVLDVCGAPTLVHRLAQRLPPQGRLFVLGAGKAGTLALAAARAIRPDLQLYAVDVAQEPLTDLLNAGLVDAVRAVDAADALAVRKAVAEMTHGHLVDAAVNMTSLPGTEMATVLTTRTRGTCLFFGMATSFARVALGAEGVGADVDLLIGNGYADGHAAFALQLVRDQPKLRALLERRLGQS